MLLQAAFLLNVPGTAVWPEIENLRHHSDRHTIKYVNMWMFKGFPICFVVFNDIFIGYKSISLVSKNNETN